jgi:hypothetical protein
LFENIVLARFQLLTAANMKVAGFWVVAPCRAEIIRVIVLVMEAASTSETSVNFTGLHDGTTQKTAVFMLINRE